MLVLRVEVKAQLVKLLPDKHQELRLDPQQTGQLVRALDSVRVCLTKQSTGRQRETNINIWPPRASPSCTHPHTVTHTHKRPDVFSMTATQGWDNNMILYCSQISSTCMQIGFHVVKTLLLLVRSTSPYSQKIGVQKKQVMTEISLVLEIKQSIKLYCLCLYRWSDWTLFQPWLMDP